MNPQIETRDVPPRTAFALEQQGLHPLQLGLATDKAADGLWK